MKKLRVSGCATIAGCRVISLKSGNNGLFISDHVVSEIHKVYIGSLRQKIERILDDFKSGKDYIELNKEDIKENKIILRSCGFKNTSLDRSTKIYLLGLDIYCKLLDSIKNDTVEKYFPDILNLVFESDMEEVVEVKDKVDLPARIVVEDEVEIGSTHTPIVVGGFGEDEIIISELQVAQLHNRELVHIRQAVKRLKNKLVEGVDYIDLSKYHNCDICLETLGYTHSQMSAKNYYVFSKRGYLKLVKHFNTDESWELFETLLENYFDNTHHNHDIVSNDNTDRANALLMAIEGKTVADRTIGLQKYTELLTSDMQQTIDAQNLLIDTIVSDDSIYAVSLVGRVLKSYNPKVFGKVKIFEMMRASGILISSRKKDEHNTPHYSYSKYFEVKLREIMLDNGDKKVVPKTYFNAKGLEWFLKRVSKEGLIDKSKIKEIKDIIVNVDKTSLAA